MLDFDDFALIVNSKIYWSFFYMHSVQGNSIKGKI